MERRALLKLGLVTGGWVLSPQSASAAPLQRELLRQSSRLGAALPWVELAQFPTPVQEFPALARALGLGRLFVKRDDRAGAVYGGSKVRKLELLIGAAEAAGHTTLVASGGVGSNQTLSTAFYARLRGLSARLYLLPERPSAAAREHLLAQAELGAEQHLVGSDAQVERAVRRAKDAPYVIALGGSSPLGNVGFVEAGLELAAQVRAGMLPEPAVIYLPLGTGGSAVGLALGLARARLRSKVVAVRTASQRFGTPAGLRRALGATSRLVHELEPSFPLTDKSAALEVREGFVGRGYAEPTASGRRALALAKEHAALELDTTYSAKTMAALAASAKTHASESVLFWLTFDARRVSTGRMQAADLPRELRGYTRVAREH